MYPIDPEVEQFNITNVGYVVGLTTTDSPTYMYFTTEDVAQDSSIGVGGWAVPS